jgi:hypothetical protein
MSKMTDRERGFEAKYGFDLEQNFRVEAHLYKMLARWAAGEMGKDADEADGYALAVVGNVISNPRENGIVEVLMADFAKNGVDISASQINAKIEELRPIAREEVL